MKKAIVSLIVVTVFLGFWGSALAAQDFDYFFGRFLISTSDVVSIAPIQVVSTQVSVSQNQNQIASMQASLSQMKTTLATLNSSLAKPASANSVLAVKKPSKVAVARGIPLLLPESKKEEKDTLSVFASLIPPDVKNFPLLSTYLVILTLALFGVIIYLYFIRRQARKLI